MKKYILISCILLPYYSFTQFKTSHSTSTSMGRGGLGISIKEPENIFNNLAATQSDTSHHILMGFNLVTGFPGLTEISLAYLKNRKLLSWGLEAFRWGNEDFTYQYLGLGLIQRRGIATLGLKLKYIQTGSMELVVFHLFECDIGTHVQLSESVEVGLLASNLNRSLLKRSFSEYIPLILVAGIHYKYNEKLSFSGELSKTEGYDHRLGIGWEYNFRKNWVLRSGVSSTPPRIQFGLTVGLSRMGFSYGMFTQPLFGNTHAWNLDYSY